ncbi:MAG: hypothetical protein IJB53_02465 [Mailhella sp.]|nr:hypothetical protein [Mailhella sp.]
MIDRVYDRFMHVCNKSGRRGKGLQTRLSDAGSFVRILSKLNHESNLFREMEWMIKNAEAIHQFFSAINDCCFATAPSEIVKGVIKLKKDTYVHRSMVVASLFIIFGSKGERLQEIQNKNRIHLIFIKSIPLLQENIGFVESWIEDNELFFEDMKEALEEIFQFERQERDKIPWVGKDLWELGLFNTNFVP